MVSVDLTATPTPTTPQVHEVGAYANLVDPPPPTEEDAPVSKKKLSRAKLVCLTIKTREAEDLDSEGNPTGTKVQKPLQLLPLLLAVP